MDDKKLLHNLKKKNEKALILLIERYSPYICTIIRNTANHSIPKCDVEEIASDVFMKLWNTPEKIYPETIKSYIAVISRNLAVDYLRKQKREVPYEEIELTDSTDIEDNVFQHIEHEELQNALNELKSEYKELLLRFYFLYQPVLQIAKEMNISEASCKTGLHRARKQLKAILCRKGYRDEK